MVSVEIKGRSMKGGIVLRGLPAMSHFFPPLFQLPSP